MADDDVPFNRNFPLEAGVVEEAAVFVGGGFERLLVHVCGGDADGRKGGADGDRQRRVEDIRGGEPGVHGELLGVRER